MRERKQLDKVVLALTSIKTISDIYMVRKTKYKPCIHDFLVSGSSTYLAQAT